MRTEPEGITGWAFFARQINQQVSYAAYSVKYKCFKPLTDPQWGLSCLASIAL